MKPIVIPTRAGRAIAAALFTAMLLAGCGGDDGSAESSTSTTPAPTTPSPPANRAPSISGSPATSATVGAAYSFTPNASDPDGDRLTYTLQNAPPWASFDAASGRLAGTPASSDIGTYANISIRVADATAAATLASFTITVNGSITGSAQLSWSPPTQREDGSALTNLAGYRVYYGRSADSLTSSVRLDNPGLSAYVVEGLATGRWYFAISAVDAAGLESRLSVSVMKSIA